MILLKIFAGLIVILVFMPVRFVLTKRDHKHIRAYLKQRNNQLFDIVWKPGNPLVAHDGSYEVTYLTPGFELFIARCRVGRSSELFWTDPEYLCGVSPKQWELMLRQKNNPDSLWPSELPPEKEKLMDGLTSAYKHERMWTAKRIQELDSVDEQILFILKDMSTKDPDPEIREVAEKTVVTLENQTK